MKTKWLQKGFTLASQVVQNGSLNTLQNFHYQQLSRFLTNSNSPNELDVVENSFNGIQAVSSDEDTEHLQSDEQNRLGSKRLRLDEYGLDDLEDINSYTITDEDEPTTEETHTTFKISTKRPRNLNETHVLSETASKAKCKATFCTDPSASSSATAKTKNNLRTGKLLSSNKSNMVSNLLSEQMVKTPTNADQLKSGKYLHFLIQNLFQLN